LSGVERKEDQMETYRMRSKPLKALLFYVLLTLLFLYPIPFELGRVVSIAPDTFLNLWNFWWVKKALLDLHTSPYFTDYIFYPTGTSLVFQTFSPYNALLAIPLQGIWNRIVAYNLLYLSSFPLAALGGYLLAFHLVRDRLAALLAGFIFAFSPYHFSRAMQVNIFSIQWIPFYCLFLIKLRERPGWRYALMAALFLLLTALCSWYYMVYLFLFTALYLIFYAVREPRSILKPRFCLFMFLSFSIFAIAIAPLVLPLLREVSAGETYLYRSVRGETDLLGITALKGYFYFWPVFLGYTALSLSIYSACLLRGRGVRFWVILAIFAFIMCLGPHLVIFRKEFPGIPLPFALMHRVPILQAARIPYRFLVLLMLSLAVLSAYAVGNLRRKARDIRGPGKGVRGAAPFILFIIAGIEFLVIPRPTFSPEVPPFYRDLAHESGDFAIVSLPFKDRGWDLYYQTVHEKKCTWAYTTRTNPAAMNYLASTPPFDLFLHPDRIVVGKITPEEVRSYRETLESLHVHYVLINKPRRYGHPRRIGRPGSVLNMIRVGITPYFLNTNLHTLLVEIEEMRSDIRTTDEEMNRFRDLLHLMLGEVYYEDSDVIVYRVGGV